MAIWAYLALVAAAPTHLFLKLCGNSWNIVILRIVGPGFSPAGEVISETEIAEIPIDDCGPVRDLRIEFFHYRF